MLCYALFKFWANFAAVQRTVEVFSLLWMYFTARKSRPVASLCKHHQNAEIHWSILSYSFVNHLLKLVAVDKLTCPYASSRT